MLLKSSHLPHSVYLHWKRWFFILAMVLLYLFLLVSGVKGQQGMPWHWMHMPRALQSWTSVKMSSPPAADSELLITGKKVYLNNCAACHGDMGKGDGRWANYLVPRPRNFSRGIFRFKSTPSGTLPTDNDLFRTISAGINATAMPSWQFVLPEKERWAVVSYLKTLCKDFAEEAAGKPIILTPSSDITPGRMVQEGKEIFRKNCVECHGPEGYGDGPSALNMEDSFGDPIEPRNFHRAAEFKRGHTLADIALVVATGNDGTPMPSFDLGKENIWNVASFVMSLAKEKEEGSEPNGYCPMGMGMRMGMKR
ncbi:MAG: c-type cytochrome [Acidobacteria bacterium]|nr:c-type cytochrome [Acidobacteriota bacterium]